MILEFEQELALLQADIITMFASVREAVDTSVKGLKLRDGALIQSVMDGDNAINLQECQCTSLGLKLLALKQPVARDLRQIVGSLRIASNLERIGDEAVNIADRGAILLERAPLEGADQVWDLAQLTLELFDKAQQAFAVSSTDVCDDVFKTNQATNALQSRVFRELTEIMIKHSRAVERAEQLAFVSYSLKRICDRCSNICESVVFMVKGLEVMHKECRITG